MKAHGLRWKCLFKKALFMIRSPPKMAPVNRTIPVAIGLLLSFFLFVGYFSRSHESGRWYGISQTVGMENWVQSHGQKDSAYSSLAGSGGKAQDYITTPKTPKISFVPGQPRPPGSNYTKTLVIGRQKDEAVDWVNTELPPEITRAIYVVDDPKAPLHPPKNKGHEVMVYLSYIIDHYDELPDVAMFMHAHQISWHNADVFDLDAAEMIRRLSPERVTREGYMSMRCQWSPGCPDWMHPGETNQNATKKEEVLIAKAWAELFPMDPVPDILAAPCCAQFAVSRGRMQAIPKATYVYYRDWLLHTPLKDFVSGRIWEYMWQYIFTGEASFCPIEHICYCDGFGVCFGGEQHYNDWWDIRNERDAINSEWLQWEAKAQTWNSFIEVGYTVAELESMKSVERPKEGMNEEYGKRIEKLQGKLDRRLEAALRRGDDPKLRAQDSGREWHDGDGY